MTMNNLQLDDHKNNTEQKKPVREEHRLYDSFTWQVYKQAKLTHAFGSQDSGSPWGDVSNWEGRWEWLLGNC